MGSTTVINNYIESQSTREELMAQAQKINSDFKGGIVKDIANEKVSYEQSGIDVADKTDELAKAVSLKIMQLFLGKTQLTQQDKKNLDKDTAYRTVVRAFQVVLDTIIKTSSVQGTKQKGSYLYSGGLGISRVFYQIYAKKVTGKKLGQGEGTQQLTVIMWTMLGITYTEQMTDMQLRSLLETMDIPFHVRKDLYECLKGLCKK